MAENIFVNLSTLSFDAINGMKKKDLFDHIESLMGKVVVGNDIQGLLVFLKPSTTYHRLPTNRLTDQRPQTSDQPTTNQMHRS